MFNLTCFISLFEILSVFFFLFAYRLLCSVSLLCFNVFPTLCYLLNVLPYLLFLILKLCMFSYLRFMGNFFIFCLLYLFHFLSYIILYGKVKVLWDDYSNLCLFEFLSAFSLLSLFSFVFIVFILCLLMSSICQSIAKKTSNLPGCLA